MKTYYDITLSIDDKEYAVRIRDLTKEEAIRHKKQAKKIEDENLAYSRLAREANELLEDVNLNQKIIDNAKDEDIDIGIIKEQKKLLKRLRSVNLKLQNRDKDILLEKMNDTLFEMLKIRLSKGGAKEYLAQIKERHLDMATVMIDVSKAITKEKEKK